MTRDVFNDLIIGISGKLYRIAFRILLNRQEAEDVVQEVFMKMWMMGDKLDIYNDAEALAVTMVRNGAIDQLRKRKHTFDISSGADLHIQQSSPSPFDLIAGSESYKALRRIINELPYGFREVLIMKDVNGLSYEEIASVISVNVNSLRVTLSRARQMVREKYLNYSYERRKAEGTD